MSSRHLSITLLFSSKPYLSKQTFFFSGLWLILNTLILKIFYLVSVCFQYNFILINFYIFQHKNEIEIEIEIHSKFPITWINTM